MTSSRFVFGAVEVKANEENVSIFWCIFYDTILITWQCRFFLCQPKWKATCACVWTAFFSMKIGKSNLMWSEKCVPVFWLLFVFDDFDLEIHICSKWQFEWHRRILKPVRQTEKKFGHRKNRNSKQTQDKHRPFLFIWTADYQTKGYHLTMDTIGIIPND